MRSIPEIVHHGMKPDTRSRDALWRPRRLTQALPKLAFTAIFLKCCGH